MGKLLEIALQNRTILTKFVGTIIRYALGYLVGLGIQYLGTEYAPDLQKLTGDLEPFLTMLVISLVMKARQGAATGTPPDRVH